MSSGFLANFSMGALLAGLIFSGIGVHFFRIAKREGNMKLLGASLALFIYPYFVEGAYTSWGLGLGLTWLAYSLVER